MPPNTIKVARPSPWGNPFAVMPNRGPVRAGALYVSTAREAVDYFRDYMAEQMREHQCVRDAVAELRGKNLACWCRLDEPCHADVLIELANATRD